MSFHLGDRPSKNIPWAVFNANFPETFSQNQWSIATAGGSETPSIDIIIFDIPSGNELKIQDIEYRVDGGQPISLGVNKSGSYRIFGFEEEQHVNIELRTVTRKGASGWSDVKGIFVLLVSLQDTLFANSEQGAFFDIAPQYLFQDAAGTVPVTEPGQTVGRVLDLSGNGHHATQAINEQRPVYRTDGTRHWLEFDGVDDRMELNGSMDLQAGSIFLALMEQVGMTGHRGLVSSGTAGYVGLTGSGADRALCMNASGLMHRVDTPAIFPMTPQSAVGIQVQEGGIIHARRFGDPTSYSNSTPGAIGLGNVNTLMAFSPTAGQGARVDFFGAVLLPGAVAGEVFDRTLAFMNTRIAA